MHMAPPRESMWGKTQGVLVRTRCLPNLTKMLHAEELCAGMASQNETLMYIILT
jgi:hypothetical protein